MSENFTCIQIPLTVPWVSWNVVASWLDTAVNFCISPCKSPPQMTRDNKWFSLTIS